MKESERGIISNKCDDSSSEEETVTVVTDLVGMIRDTCPRCGRGGSGKQNLITRQDIETQAVYLDQRGYFFKNPYWNVTSVPKILPEPYLFEDIMVSDIGLAIKERKEEEEKKLKEKFIKLRKGHYIPGAIHKDVPASQYGSLKSMRESLRESTFYLKPMNEQEFAPHALTERKWEKLPDELFKEKYLHLKREEPIRHIEGRVDNTRQGYVCYLPGTFTTFSRAFDRVNDERLIFTMSEDQMFEEFNEENIGGQKVKLPVQSCVFCPGGRGMSTSTNDDEPIVRPQTLIGVHQDASAEEVSGLLDSICHDPKIVKNLEGRELENLQDIINKLRGGSYIQGLSGGATENLNQSEDIIKAELGRRDDEIQAQEDKKDFLEQQQQELENQRTEYENEKGIRIEELRENRAEINRKQNEIRNLNDTSKEIRKKIDDCDKSIRNTETLVGNLTSQVNQARTDANRATSRAEEERLRDYADKLQGELNTAQIQLNTHKSRLRELQTDFETNREAIYTVKKDIEELEKRNDLLNKQNKELDEEIKKTREKGKVNQNEIEKIKDDLREKPSGGDRGGRGGGTTEEPPKKTTGDISITLNLANDDYVFRAYSNTLSISLSIARAYRDCLAEKMSGFTYDYYNPSTEDDHGVYVDSHNNLTYGIKVTYFK
ncbi:10365_t:CDS:2 [Funneliformis geosporum]|nr:10365_t:CDS:2 [Funneliformis geosporum]